MAEPLTRRQVLGGFASIGAMGTAGCVSNSYSAEEVITREYDASDITELQIETASGNINIRDSEDDSIRIEGAKAAATEGDLDDVSLNSNFDQGVMNVAVETDGGWLSLGPTPQIRLTILVPQGLPINVESTNGTVNVDMDNPGDIGVKTTSSDINLTLENQADVTADSTNGDVIIDFPESGEPEVSFETTNGAVEIRGFGEEPIEAESSIETTIGVGANRIAVETTNGDLTVH